MYYLLVSTKRNIRGQKPAICINPTVKILSMKCNIGLVKYIPVYISSEVRNQLSIVPPSANINAINGTIVRQRNRSVRNTARQKQRESRVL